MYRPDVDEPAAAYRFPFDEASFDFVFSNSLFTHLMQDDLENYLREIGRVLRPGGRALNTFFLLNRESEAAIANSGRKMKFPHPVEGRVARTQRRGLPEAAIAYEEDFVREAHADANRANRRRRCVTGAGLGARRQDRGSARRTSWSQSPCEARDMSPPNGG